MHQLSLYLQSWWSYTLSFEGGHCEFLPGGVISRVMVDLMDPGASLPGFQFQLSHILGVYA